LRTLPTTAPASGKIERIKNARFNATRLSAGYDEEEVGTFLDELIAILSEGGQPRRQPVLKLRLPSVVATLPPAA
jgi:DivIVA domain-containing protein